MIGSIQAQIKALKIRLKELQKRLRELEEAYESLCLFSGSVDRARGDFNDVNGQKKCALASLDPVLMRSESAAEYREGMGETLDGVGTKIVGAAFVGLSGLVQVRKLGYEAEITWHKAEIKLVQKTIRELEEMLAMLMAAEELLG